MTNTGYHTDFGATVNYSVETMPRDADAQVRQTMRRLRAYLRTDAQNPVFKQHAAQLAPEGSDRIQSVWDHVKRHMRFQEDENTAARLQDNAGVVSKDEVVEVLVRPLDQALLIELRGTGVEDCDGFVLYAGCLLTALGIPVTLATIAANPDEPGEYSHVYVVAYPNGVGNQPRIPLDFSHGPYPGWEPPNLGRMREWPVEESFGERLWDGVVVVAVLGGALLGVHFFNRRAHA